MGSIDELAERHASTGQFDRLAIALDEIDPSALTPADAESWYRYRGIAEWRQGHAEAIKWFEAGLKRLPESGVLAFALGQSLQERGRWPEAMATFAAVRFGRTPAQQSLGLSAVEARYIMTIARYCYLWGAFDDGLAHLQPFLDAYGQLRIADDTFLYLRGLPFAHEVLETEFVMCLLVDAPDRAQQTLQWAERRLSDIDLRQDRLCLQAWISGDWRPLQAALREQGRKLNEFTKAHRAYIDTQLATIDTRFSPSITAGQARLDEVNVGPADFPWLADLKPLAVFGLASRFGDDGLREAAAAEFLQHQPLLFEPHHVFNFGLFGVQEPLRDRYQASRRAA